jgi:dTMP kinase
VPRAVAAGRAARRERTEPGRTRDRYEADEGLQERTSAVYRELAATGWLAPWTVLDGAAVLDYAALARDLMG